MDAVNIGIEACPGAKQGVLLRQSLTTCIRADAVNERGVEPARAARQSHHLHMPGQAKRLGQIAVDSSARGFGWVLGGDFANQLFHSAGL